MQQEAQNVREKAQFTDTVPYGKLLLLKCNKNKSMEKMRMQIKVYNINISHTILKMK